MPSRKPSARVQRRKDRTRERIVTEAMRLFTEQGFEATTVAQISEAADIGKGTFFTYFPAKQDVFSYLSEQVLQVVIEHDDPGQTAARRLRNGCEAAADWLEQHEPLARQMILARLRTFPASPPSPPRPRAHARRAAVIQAGVTSGEFRPIPVEDAVRAVASAYFMPTALWALGPQGAPLRDRMLAQVDIVLTGLAARP